MNSLRLARQFDLPVICHVRKSQDKVLKGLRVHDVHCGIAHAFNGSFQQAEAFIAHSMYLGLGESHVRTGAAGYGGSRRTCR